MGCCVSTPRAAPYDQDRPNAGSQPQSQAHLARPSTQGSSRNRQSSQPSQSLSKHINKRLKRAVWTSEDRVWTAEELNRERDEFFDTRVDGRQEIWQTIRVVLEILSAPEDLNSGLATAQEMLNAAAITLPTGNMADGVYDSFGALYEMPYHIVADPQNISSRAPALATDNDETLGRDKGSGSTEPPGADTQQEVDEEEAQRRREEKGKGVLNDNLVLVKIRMSDRGGLDLKIHHGRHDSVKLLILKIRVKAGLNKKVPVRLYYLGKKMEENKSLEEQGFNHAADHVVNALVMAR